MPPTRLTPELWMAQFLELANRWGVEQISDKELIFASEQRRLGEWPQAVAWELWHHNQHKGT